MAYKLYDKDGNEVTHHNLQDKGAWCVAGASLEEGFVQVYGQRLNLAINPAKADSPYVPDLINTVTGIIGDLKTQNTPFFQAQPRFGLDPQYAVVFNGKDRERYSQEYPGIDIYFGVDWIVTKFVSRETIAVEPMVGVWMIPFTTLDELCKKAPYHTYQQRYGDTKGNAKGSYVLDLQHPYFQRLI